RVETFGAGLRAAGFVPGDAVILASPLSVDFYALAIAIVASRMQLVLIDGRLDRRRLLSALRSARAKAIVSVPEALRRWPAVPPRGRAAQPRVCGDDRAAARRPPRAGDDRPDRGGRGNALASGHDAVGRAGVRRADRPPRGGHAGRRGADAEAGRGRRSAGD